MRHEGKYVWVGQSLTEHAVKAEKALGKTLPKGAEIHHVDFNGLNNENSNLVICPTRSYHRLLHTRTNALNACGNANWLKCCHCFTWDDPKNLKVWKYGNGVKAHHVECNRKYQRKIAEKKRNAKS